MEDQHIKNSQIIDITTIKSVIEHHLKPEEVTTTIPQVEQMKLATNSKIKDAQSLDIEPRIRCDVILIRF